MICNSCPRKCNIDRDVRLGYCKSPSAFRVARCALHYWEEPCISGESGSGAVFFSGCSLGCVYCQNHEISHEGKGREISDGRLIEIFESLIEQGAANINLVNPTHYAERLADVLSKWHSPVPIVYNSSGYENIDTLRALDGLIDIYLPDFKYIRSDRARRYSGAADYPETAMRALEEMRRQVGEDEFDDKGMMRRGMIIRHLILPSNTNPSIEVIDYLKEHFSDTYISLMAQYVPCGSLNGFDEINRPLTQREYDKVVNYAISSGLELLFIQELSAASKDYIPSFNFEGID